MLHALQQKVHDPISLRTYRGLSRMDWDGLKDISDITEESNVSLKAKTIEMDWFHLEFRHESGAILAHVWWGLQAPCTSKFLPEKPGHLCYQLYSRSFPSALQC